MKQVEKEKNDIIEKTISKFTQIGKEFDKGMITGYMLAVISEEEAKIKAG